MPDYMDVFGWDLNNGRGFITFKEAKMTWDENVPWGSRWLINFRVYEVVDIMGKPYFNEEVSDGR